MFDKATAATARPQPFAAQATHLLAQPALQWLATGWPDASAPAGAGSGAYCEAPSVLQDWPGAWQSGSSRPGVPDNQPDVVAFSPFNELTPREREVFRYIALGKPNKVIAIELGLSQRTVEAHRSRIFTKFKVRNAVELVRCATAYVLTQGRSPCVWQLIGAAAGRPSDDASIS